jgi:hypothetical protein
MEKPGALPDIDRIMDRLMINLYKGQIRKTRPDPRTLKGSWDEACTILEVHLDKLVHEVHSNERRLLSLYQDAPCGRTGSFTSPKDGSIFHRSLRCEACKTHVLSIVLECRAVQAPARRCAFPGDIEPDAWVVASRLRPGYLPPTGLSG